MTKRELGPRSRALWKTRAANRNVNQQHPNGWEESAEEPRGTH